MFFKTDAVSDEIRSLSGSVRGSGLPLKCSWGTGYLHIKVYKKHCISVAMEAHRHWVKVAVSPFLESGQEMVMLSEAHVLSLSVFVFVSLGWNFWSTGLRFGPHLFLWSSKPSMWSKLWTWINLKCYEVMRVHAENFLKCESWKDTDPQSLESGLLLLVSIS